MEIYRQWAEYIAAVCIHIHSSTASIWIYNGLGCTSKPL